MSGLGPKTEDFRITEMGEMETDASSTHNKSGVFERYVQPCVAEMFGTTAFVFVGCASVMGSLGTSGVLQPAVAHGLTLGVMIALFGQISGGHFNPVVSLSAYLCGGMELVLLLPYIVAQVLGGMVGAGLVRAVFPSVLYDATTGGAFTVVSSDLALITLTEAILTTFLTMAVCLGAVNRQTRSPLAPFCIGLTVMANIFAGGTLSGACMNPARAFGPAVVANYWNHHWIFWVGPICGALATVSLVRLAFGDKKTRILFK
ncbi:aquaporin-8-like [Chelmon rostratus]|uniref:aquaporin-8-like n=1 Tax=Chelmon rostratus TaxID=109905 RepID=UPI001BEB6416|nr:aquaporin-8-like [Chelmon rostratus]